MRARAASRSGRSRWTSLLGLLAIALALFVVLLTAEVMLLPSNSASRSLLPAATAAPVSASMSFLAAAEATANALALLSSSAIPPRPKSLSFSSSHGPPNISVVVPCYGHVNYLEESLLSVVRQRYPPVEILIVDDGSPERCSDAARSLLLGNVIAAPRKRQVQTLAKWWGWGAAELAYFHDEVLLTPNRGVAHARNAGIRRARGDWIVCLDGDDTISDMYFLKAMERVSAVPRTNLVYANQQFFGESRWQWTVPPLRPDSALVNGPLPLMSIWRRDLWFGTPHGFDEALPKGHEDWAFWLQLMRLPLVHFKIDEFLTQYRYKKNSKMRNREHNNPEIPRLMRCLFPDLYPVRKLLLDHHELLKPGRPPEERPGITEAVVMDISVSIHLHPARSAPQLWNGMVMEAKGDVRAAAASYRKAAALAPPYDWQGSYRLWRALAALEEAEAADREEEALRRRYMSDVDGAVLPSVQATEPAVA